MADLQKTIEIVFGAVDDVSGLVDSINKKISDMSGAIGSATDPLATVHDGVMKLEAALAVLAAGGAAYSILKFAEFEDVMLKVKGILQASESEYEALTRVTRDLGSTTRYTATEAAQGLEFLALAGFTATESMEAIPEVLNLAQAAAIDLGSAADIVTNIMAGYGVEVEGLAQANDVLTATFTNSNTNLEQLGAAFKFVGPVAKSLGLDLEETASILGILGNAGYQAEMGGTALRNILLALVAPAGNMGKLMKELGVNTSDLGVDLSDSKNALKSLGVEVKDSEGNLKPFVEIMDQMKAGLDKIPESADRTAILIEIFGKRGGPQMAALLEQGSGSVAALEAKIRSLGGVTQKIAEEMESGMGGALRAMKSAFDEIAISIGDKMADALEESIDGVIAIERVMGDIIKSDTFDPVFKAIKEFADELGKDLKKIAENLPEAMADVDFGPFVESLKSIQSEFGSLFDAFFGDVDLTTPEGLESAIQKIVNAATSLNNVVAGVIDGWERWAEWLGELVDKFGDMDESTAKTIGQSLQLGKELNVVSGVVGSLSGALNGLSNLLNVLAVKHLVGMVTSFGSVTAATAKWGTAVNALAGTAAGAAGLVGISYTIGLLIGKIANHNQMVRDAAQAVIGWADELLNFSGTQNKATDSAEGFDKLIAALIGSTEKYKYDLTDLRKELAGMGKDVENLPDETIFKLAAEADILSVDDAHKLIQGRIDLDPPYVSVSADVGEADQKIKAFWEDFLDLPNKKDVDINVNADTTELEETQNYIKWLDENGTEHVVYIDADTKQVDDAGKKIDDLPSEKMLEIQLQGDIETKIASIAAQAETAQAAFQYKAEVDIAEAQANADILVSAYEAAGTSVEALAGATSDMFGSLADAMSTLDLSDQFALESILDRQMEQEAKMVESQIALNDAQVAYMEARTEALARGDSLIQIDSTGLEPALEMIMWQIIEKVQVRANESSADFLLGLNA